MALHRSNIQYQYIAYIDESGDTGLRSIRPASPQGSSEWLIVSAVLVRQKHEPEMDAWLNDMRGRLINFKAREIHFADLSERNKSISCQYLSKRPVKIFAVCSNKKNMVGYKNPFAELRSLDNNWFYCWLTRVLLERVTHFVTEDAKKNAIINPKVKLVFSHRGGMSYSQLNAYSALLKLQTRVGGLWLDTGRVYFDVLNMDQTEILSHSACSGLKFPDISASAFFKACDLYHTKNIDPSHAISLKPKVAYTDYQGKFDVEKYVTYSGYGVKILPTFHGAKLRQEQQQIFRFYGYPRQWWDPTSHTPSPYRLATISPTVAMDASDKMPDA